MGDDVADTVEPRPPGAYAGADARWSAVLARDPAADGHFVYAVRTTGVFCRPSCKSRPPLRKNVELFAHADEAVRAGYRACKRCRPLDSDPRQATDALLVRACRRLESTEEVVRSRELAAEIGLSPHYFQRWFKERTGVTPQEYRRRAKAERAKRELVEARSVTEAVYAAGYSSSSRFYEGVGRELGMTARELRAGALGHTVRYAVRACSLGQLLVAWTERGVCDVRFGDAEEDLARALQARFPAAARSPADVPEWVDRIVEMVERPRRHDVPLDIQGTAFQQRVWRELRRIPPGETRTYTDIARALGSPSSVRAVARACAANTLAVVTPCHRVVRSDGDLAGYRWGRARKEALLRRESKGR